MNGRPAPPPPVLAEALDALLCGDPAPLRALLPTLDTLPTIERLHWELSTLYGQPLPVVVVRQGPLTLPGTVSFRSPLVTGGPPRTFTAPDWTTFITPPSRARHAEGLRRSYAALDGPAADAAAAVLRHHTELPVDLLAGRPWLDAPGADRAAEQARLAHVPTTDLDLLIAQGLVSSSLPRRDLAWRLSQLG